MKMKKNKTPPDNTGKKYLTELTAKQQKFIDLYCSRYGELSASDCARIAGYEASSAHTRATELLDWSKNPKVVAEIDTRLADSRKLWSIDRDKSLAALFKIKQKADKKGNYGVAAKCEELRAKLGGLFIERIQTMNINKELSKEDIDTNIKKLFPDKKAYLEGQLSMMQDLYTEEDNSLDNVKWADDVLAYEAARKEKKKKKNK